MIYIYTKLDISRSFLKIVQKVALLALKWVQKICWQLEFCSLVAFIIPHLLRPITTFFILSLISCNQLKTNLNWFFSWRWKIEDTLNFHRLLQLFDIFSSWLVAYIAIVWKIALIWLLAFFNNSSIF